MLKTACRNVNRNVGGMITTRTRRVAVRKGSVLTPQQMSDFIKNLLALQRQK